MMLRWIGLALVMGSVSMAGCSSSDDSTGSGGKSGSGGTTSGGGGSGGSTGGSGGSTGGSGGTAGSSTGGMAGTSSGGMAGTSSGGMAGAAGGGGGLTCANYCSIIMANCTDANSQYASNDACMTACAAWPVGSDSDTTGNTLGCHTYHAGKAADDATLHCPHAGPTGGGVCV
jgi:hypothetical protein